MFLTSLIVRQYSHWEWQLLTPLIYVTRTGDRLQVPAGFISDLASIPRPLWWLYPPWGKYSKAAVLHDWLYFGDYGDRSRLEADRLFLEAMEASRVDFFTRTLFYWAVRLLGHPWYGYKMLH